MTSYEKCKISDLKKANSLGLSLVEYRELRRNNSSRNRGFRDYSHESKYKRANKKNENLTVEEFNKMESESEIKKINIIKKREERIKYYDNVKKYSKEYRTIKNERYAQNKGFKNFNEYNKYRKYCRKYGEMTKEEYLK